MARRAQSELSLGFYTSHPALPGLTCGRHNGGGGQMRKCSKQQSKLVLTWGALAWCQVFWAQTGRLVNGAVVARGGEEFIQ